MPRQYLGEIPLARGGALLRRRSGSPIRSAWPVREEENHDAYLDRMEREARSVLRRMRQLSWRVTERSAELRQLSARVTERSAEWRRLRFGSSVRRRRWQRSAPQPSHDDEQDLDEYDEGPTEASTEIESEADRYVDNYDDAATRGTTTPRLSMPMGSDDDDGSGSDPELSVLAMARGSGHGAQTARTSVANTREEQMLLQQQAEAMAYEDEVMSQGRYEAEETSIGEQVEDDEDEEQEEQEMLVDPASIGLKEISNLGKFTVSSHKPGNGVAELRSDDLKLYWQSDGPQPHKLTVYFIKRVGIRVIRFYVDYQEDESYTPTKIVFKSGTSENNMIEFATMTMDSPYGWQDVPIEGAGGEPDGNTLVSYVLQMQILENHQNGKDTHLRGIKIYAFDPDSGHQQASGRWQRRRRQDETEDEVAGGSARAKGRSRDDGGDGSGMILGGTSSDRLSEMARILAESTLQAGEAGFSAADFLREPELR